MDNFCEKTTKNNDFSEIDRQFATNAKPGAAYTRDRTVFRVWSPLAERVSVRLYRAALDDEPFAGIPMVSENGVWSAVAEGDLNGVYYTLCVTRDGAERETIDPYAKSACANGRRGMVYDPARIDRIEPIKPFAAVPKSEAVICELHVRDFSMDGSADFTARGKFEAFTERGVVTVNGDCAGLDYLAELGITHVHLLPVFDFASVDETAPNPDYNWGYDPMNCFCPEGSYSSDPNDGFSRVREFRALVNALHGRGIGVIVDVVFNHVYDVDRSPLNVVFPDYYFRRDENGGLSNGSGCGNEIASERVMARRYICDCLCHWLTEYGVDGFRFDLMGLLDIDTLNLCAERLKEINPAVLLYGEGWTGGVSPLDENRRGVIANIARLPDYSVFSDEFRDCVKGSVFADEDCGYINGGRETAKSRAETMKSALIGGVYHPQVLKGREECRSDDPAQRINYVECHDNLTFHDKLAVSMRGSTEEERVAVSMLGAALVLLAQGVPFFAAGQEFMRSKALFGETGEFVGYDRNSYRSPDSVNSLKWENAAKYRRVVDYYKGLIAIRRRFPEFRLENGGEIRERVAFTDLRDGAFAVRIGGFVLAVNPLSEPLTFSVDGRYSVYADSGRAAAEPFREIADVAEVAAHSVLLIAKISS